MSINLNVNKNTAAPVNGRGNNDFVPSEFFLNVGFMDSDPEDGTDMFIGLAKGVPINAADLKEVKGSTPKYRQMMQSKNGLLQKFLDAGEPMESGEERIVAEMGNGLVLQLKRVRAAEEPDVKSNPFMDKLSSIDLG